MLDSEFMPWSKLSTDRLAREYEAQSDFVPAKHTHYPLSLNTTNRNKKNKLRDKAIQRKRFIPGKVFYPLNVDSCLTKRQQAICLSILKLYQSGHDLNHLPMVRQLDLETYKSLQTEIQEEHIKYLEYVKNEWKKTVTRIDNIKPLLGKYALQQWDMKFRKTRSYSQFFKMYGNVCLAYDDPNQVQVAIEQNVLSYGTPLAFMAPTLTSKCHLDRTQLPMCNNNYTYNSKLPVSRDVNVTRILQNYDVDVVISMSGIKRLMDDSNNNRVWNIPFTVKECQCKLSNGNIISKNVVYIDKPLPLQSPTNVDFNEYCHKHLIQMNLRVQTAESSEPCLEERILNPDYCLSPNSNEEPKTDKNCNLNLHNVNYSIWNISRNSEQNVLLKTRTEDKNIKFLLRQKVMAYETMPDGTKRSVVLTPKLEYQVEYGASICTKYELVRQWADLFFRPFSHLYRVRILGGTSEVIHTESVSLQKINTEAMQHYQSKPHERLGALFTVFSQLSKLELGNYLLHHNLQTGVFAEILKETDSKTNVKFDLTQEYDISKCTVKSAKDRPWCPIDVNYILDVHTIYKRMPGMFKPLLTIAKTKKKGKKKKAKKGKNANKKQQEEQQTN